MKKGFTLIELVMVIVILGILAAMALPRFVDLTTQAKQAASQGSLGAMRAAVAIQYASNAATGDSTPIPASITADMFQQQSIPYNEMGTKSNTVSNEYSGAGGWVYISSNGTVFGNTSDSSTW